MKAKPYKYIPTEGKDGAMRRSVPCEASEADYVELHMEGHFPLRHIPVILKGSRRDQKGPVWSWNGDVDKPTLKPSILSKIDEYGPNKEKRICHTWVNDGMVQYLNDCTHEFAGQTRPLLEVED